MENLTELAAFSRQLSANHYARVIPSAARNLAPRAGPDKSQRDSSLRSE